MAPQRDNAGRGSPILRVEELTKHFTVGGGWRFRGGSSVIRAVEGVSFDLHPGETLGLVGESGCGKSTVARLLLGLEQPTAGRAYFNGQDIFTMPAAALKAVRRQMQIVFQDPYASLNPRMRVDEIIAEPWNIHPEMMHRAARAERVRELLEGVGLRREHAERYPHQFSGGQLQRIGIARAMALEPRVLICDEPVSALDASVQAQVVNLLEEIQATHEIAYLFIAHDLSVVRHMSHRVAVMYLGRIVESGSEAEIYESPRHPYTRALLSAEPMLSLDSPAGRSRIVLKGEVPSPANPPSGCSFRNRCWKAETDCAGTPPPLASIAGDAAGQGGHRVACYHPEPPG